MLTHDSLEVRLNSIREGKKVPKMERQEVVPNYADEEKVDKNTTEKIREELMRTEPKVQFLPSEHITSSEIYSFVKIMGISFLYGEGLRSIFHHDWKILGTLGIGFLLSHLISFTLKLINK
jgi:hypothetical protein